MKDIFSYNVDINKTAYVNWRTNRHDHIHNMIIIADGFMESAIMLTKHVLEDNHDKKADILIYPIIFNANHAIELYLKAITWTLNELLDNNHRIEGQHDIKQIFDVVTARVNEFETKKERKEQFKYMTKNLRDYLNELADKIARVDENKNKDNMDFSRYPFDQKYTPHFYINEFDNVAVDMENFLNRFQEIGDNLRLISTHYLYDCLQADND